MRYTPPVRPSVPQPVPWTSQPTCLAACVRAGARFGDYTAGQKLSSDDPISLLLRAKSGSETVRGAPAASPSPAVHSAAAPAPLGALELAPRAASRASARSSPHRRAGRYMVSRAGRFGANTVPTAAAGFCIGSPRGGHAAAVPARLRRPSPPPPLCARRSPTDPSYVRQYGCVSRSTVARPCVSSKSVLPNSFIYSLDPAPATEGRRLAARAVPGRREVVTPSLVFILSYVSPGARKNP